MIKIKINFFSKNLILIFDKKKMNNKFKKNNISIYFNNKKSKMLIKMKIIN